MELLSLEINKTGNQRNYEQIKVLTNLNDNNIFMKIDSKNKDLITINYGLNHISDKKKAYDEIYTVIVNLIIDYVKNMSFDYLNENYSYFDDGEVKEIENTIAEEINNDIKIKVVIRDRITEFRGYSKTVNLDGFIKFRLKFLEEYAEKAVEQCIDVYLMKKEYSEFINALKYFSDYDSNEDITVNIFYNNSKLQIYDENLKKVSCFNNQETSREFDEISYKYDENIVSMLLALSPEEIIIHKIPSETDIRIKNTVEIIDKIFLDKVVHCNGCKYCIYE